MTRLPLIAAGLLAALLLAAPASAAPTPVLSGQLDWNQTAVYDTSVPSPNSRTWLGYVTRPESFLANGYATPEAPATRPTVHNAPQNTAVTHVFPAKTGGGASYDRYAKTGNLEFDGLLRFTGTAQGTPFDITVNDPRVALDGSTGVLSASGQNADGAAYDRSVFTLDLSAATYAQAGSTVTITGIKAAVAEGGSVFLANYPTGAGPDRSPNTFGTFSLTFTAPPNVTVTPSTDLAETQTVTVAGTGATANTDPQTGGLYLLFGPNDAPYTSADPNTTSGPYRKGLVFVAPSRIGADGSFSASLAVSRTFTNYANTAYDCVLTRCGVRTIAAHFQSDRSQDTTTPVTFAEPAAAETPAATPTTAPTASPTVTATPVPTATPTDTAPMPKTKAKVSKVKVTRKRLVFTLSRKATIKLTIKRGGKTVRTLSVKGGKGRNVVRLKARKRLRPGRYRIALVPTGGTKTTVKVTVK